MRWWIVVLAMACGSSSTTPPPTTQVTTPPSSTAPPSPVGRACVHVGEPTDHSGFWANAVAQVNDITWATLAEPTQRGNWSTHLVALDADGLGLVRADLGAPLLESTSQAFADGDGVRVIWLPDHQQTPLGPVRTLRVDVSNPDVPTVSETTELTGLPAAGWIDRAASDGSQFIVSMREANPDRTQGAYHTVLFRNGQPQQRWSEFAAATFCDGACGFVSIDSDVATLTVGSHREEQSLSGACRALSFRTEEESAVLVVSPTGYVGWGIMRDGRTRRIDRGEWDEPQVCNVGDAQGSWVSDESWIRWNGGPRISTASFEQRGRFQRYLQIGDLLTNAQFDLVSAMRHSPTDSRGRRRYFRTWELRGASLQHTDSEDVVGLPVPAAEGMGSEPSYAMLRRDSHAAVLVAHSPSQPAQLIPIARPCEP